MSEGVNLVAVAIIEHPLGNYPRIVRLKDVSMYPAGTQLYVKCGKPPIHLSQAIIKDPLEQQLDQLTQLWSTIEQQANDLRLRVPVEHDDLCWMRIQRGNGDEWRLCARIISPKMHDEEAMVDTLLYKPIVECNVETRLLLAAKAGEFLRKMRATKQATTERAANALGFLKSALEIPEQP